MHCRYRLKTNLARHLPAAFAAAKADLLLFFRLSADLLLHLVCLLARRLFPLVPVLDSEVKRIVRNLELGADARLDRLDDALRTLRLLVLVLVCAEHVVDR